MNEKKTERPHHNDFHVFGRVQERENRFEQTRSNLFGRMVLTIHRS